MTRPIPDDDLTRLLQRHDPLADDSGLDPLQTAEMRRSVLATIPDKTIGIWRQLTPALSAAALLALALGIAWWPADTDAVPPLPVPQGEATVDSEATSAGSGYREAGNALENRKIQFETPGGTLVVWVLDPNFPS